jgi:hypothetical protein
VEVWHDSGLTSRDISGGGNRRVCHWSPVPKHVFCCDRNWPPSKAVPTRTSSPLYPDMGASLRLCRSAYQAILHCRSSGGIRLLSAAGFRLEFVDLLRALCFGQGRVELLAGLTAKSLKIGNLGPCHWFPASDPLLGRLFRIWSGIRIHSCKFAARDRKGRAQVRNGISRAFRKPLFHSPDLKRDALQASQGSG